jgi:hypothetical protein
MVERSVRDVAEALARGLSEAPPHDENVVVREPIADHVVVEAVLRRGPRYRLVLRLVVYGGVVHHVVRDEEVPDLSIPLRELLFDEHDRSRIKGVIP